MLSLYTMHLKIALKELYSTDRVPEIQRSDKKTILRLGVTNLYLSEHVKRVVHAIGRFSHWCFVGCNSGKFVREVCRKVLAKTAEKIMTLTREYVLIVADALP